MSQWMMLLIILVANNGKIIICRPLFFIWHVVGGHYSLVTVLSASLWISEDTTTIGIDIYKFPMTFKEQKRMEKQIQGKIWVILMPLPFQGHINPMLELGKALHSKGFSIMVLHTKFNSPDTSNYPDFLFKPLPFHTDNKNSIIDSTNMNLFAMVIDLNVESKQPLKEFLANMMVDLPQDRIGCIVYDNLMCFCEDVAIDLKLPSVMLRTQSAIAALAYMGLPELYTQGFFPLKDTIREKTVQNLDPLRFKDLPIAEHKSIDEVLTLVIMGNRETTSPTILNTFNGIEHRSIEKLQQHYQVPFYAIGPLHKIAPSTKTSSLYEEDRSCISWLDKQAPNSVLYVSFGSLALMDEKSLIEMAWGLTHTDQPFLWVVRPGSVSGSEWIEILPNDVKERIEEKGRIVKWAPQKEVLAHRAVGGFLSHCGWNSTIESISEGVPMICYPCFGDQLVHARYLIYVWGVGLELEQEIERVKVEIVVKKLLIDEEGKGIRERAIYLKEKANNSLRKDGSSYNSLEELVKFIRNDTA